MRVAHSLTPLPLSRSPRRMPDRQHSAPVVLAAPGAPARPLKRVPLGGSSVREADVQRLLAAHPNLLPIEEIEPAYGPLVTLGTEIATESGFLDLLCVSPAGYLTLVEAKLWRNPQARREVAGQIIEYAKDLAKMTYDDLDAAVHKASGAGLLELVRAAPAVASEDEQGDELPVDEATFIDRVTRTLRQGTFLLLVVGDGIRERAETLTRHLNDAPGLGFSLALVELALFRMESEQADGAQADYPLLVVPRTVARTREVTRAVVEVRAPQGADVRVTVPDAEEEDGGGGSASRARLTEAAFFDELVASTSDELADDVRALIDAVCDLGPERTFNKRSISLRLPDPGDTDRWTGRWCSTLNGTFQVTAH